MIFFIVVPYNVIKQLAMKLFSSFFVGDCLLGGYSKNTSCSLQNKVSSSHAVARVQSLQVSNAHILFVLRKDLRVPLKYFYVSSP